MTFLLVLHDIAAVALLGVLTHQVVALLGPGAGLGQGFFARYAGVASAVFTRPVIVLFLLEVLLGATLYPTYRSDVRVEFEEMSLAWAVGAFELKEHFAGLGLALLPAYASLWREAVQSARPAAPLSFDLRAVTLLLAAVAWWDFLVGHVLNNIRGLG